MTHWIDEAAKNAALSYLRICASGGMPDDEITIVKQAIEGMVYYGHFSLGVAEAITARGLVLTPAEPAN